MSIEVHHPHDSYIRRMLSDMEVAKSLMKSHLPPDIVKRIDWESVQLTDKSFVSEDLQQFHSDIIYKFTIDNMVGYVYYLIEHQSTPDELLPFRILEYKVQLMRKHLDEGNKKLPIIISECIYAGKQSPYPYSTDIYDCFADINMAKENMFKPFKITDLTILSQEDLLQDETAGLVKVLLKQGIQRDYLNWINNNSVIIYRLIHSNLGFSSIVYILGTDDVNEPKELIEAIIKSSPDQKKLIMTAAFKLQEEARKEARKEYSLIIAKNMLKEGSEIGFIQKITGLHKEVIETLKKK